MNTLKKALPIALLIIIVGVAAFFLGQAEGKQKAISDQSASIYTATEVITNDWWPAGSGFCYHTVKSEWGRSWVLGEISKGRCIDIRPITTSQKLDNLIKQGGVTLPPSKSN